MSVCHQGWSASLMSIALTLMYIAKHKKRDKATDTTDGPKQFACEVLLAELRMRLSEYTS